MNKIIVIDLTTKKKTVYYHSEQPVSFMEGLMAGIKYAGKSLTDYSFEVKPSTDNVLKTN